MAVDVHQHVELADLQLERRERPGQLAHHRALGAHQRDPVAEAGIVPGQGGRGCHARILARLVREWAEIAILWVSYSRRLDKSFEDPVDRNEAATAARVVRSA